MGTFARGSAVMGVAAACFAGVGAAPAGEPAGGSAKAPPGAEKRAVVTEYHGVKVTDDYQWLENWADPKVRAWSEGENLYARSVLDGLPAVEAIRARVTQILSAPTVRYGGLHEAGGKLFAIKRQPPKQQPFLVVMDSADAPESARVLVDPNAMDEKGTTAIDWAIPSPDGSLVAVSMSHGGSEAGDVVVFDAASGKQVFEVVPRVNGGTAGGDLAWSKDSKGFFYSRYPRAGERPAEDMDFYTQVYYHALGTPTEKDRYELGKEFTRIAEIQLELDESSGRLLATVQDGDGGKFDLFVRSAEGKWTKLAGLDDKIVQAAFGERGEIYLISRRGSPKGEIIKVPADAPSLADASMVVASGPDAIVHDFSGEPTVVARGGRLYVTYQLGGPSEVRVFDLGGVAQPGPRIESVSSVDGMAPVAGGVMFQVESFVSPPAWYVHDAKTGQTRATALRTKSPVDFSGIEVVREFATSKDGTKVPVNIIRKKGLVLDGSQPVLVYGYGGYGVNITPSFRAERLVLLEQGVVWAVANIRGGGEFGEAWHRAGNLTKKQNVFDDFAAAVRHMSERKYTSPARTAIMGGSNGGLLMGATMVQHPDLVKAVVSHVGLYDMLRVELSPNGAFNVTEFGTVKDADQFRALYAYSPYHHVVDGTRYPSVLFLTGANDPRVDPMHSRKMTARLQAASPGSLVLLRTSSDSGHGQGTALSEQIAQTVDVDAFILDQLGVRYAGPAR